MPNSCLVEGEEHPLDIDLQSCLFPSDQSELDHKVLPQAVNEGRLKVIVEQE